MTEENTTPEAQGDNSVQPEVTEQQEEKKGKSASYIKSLQGKLEAKDNEIAELQAQITEGAKAVYQEEKQREQQEAFEAQRATNVKKVEGTLGKEVAEQVQRELDENPTLTVEKALKIVAPDQFVGGQSFNLEGAVPRTVKSPESKPKTIEEMEANLTQAWAEGRVQF